MINKILQNSSHIISKPAAPSPCGNTHWKTGNTFVLFWMRHRASLGFGTCQLELHSTTGALQKGLDYILFVGYA